MKYRAYSVSPSSPEVQPFINAVRSQVEAAGHFCAPPSPVPNDSLLSYILIERDNRPAAIAGFYHNPFIRYKDALTCSFGSLCCIDDAAALQAVLDLAVKSGNELSAKWLLGPLDGSTWDSYRLTTRGDGPPFFLEPRFPAYYKRLFEVCALSPVATYFSHKDDSLLLNPKAGLLTERFKKQGVKFRRIDPERFEQELKMMHRFCMQVFAGNFLFSPIPEKAFVNRYLPLRPYINPEFVIFAENRTAEPVGMMFVVPDHLNRDEKGLVVKTIARHPSFSYSGMTAVIGNMVVTAAKEQGYRYLIHALMHENNISRNVSGRFSGEFYREYKLYAKQINA